MDERKNKGKAAGMSMGERTGSGVRIVCAQLDRLLHAMLAIAILTGTAKAGPQDFDPNAIPYIPSRVEIPNCGGLSFESSETWEQSVSKTVDGKTRYDFEVNAEMLARSETGLGKIFVNPMVFLSVACAPHSPYKGAAPDVDRIIDRQNEFVADMVDARLGYGKVKETTKVTPIRLPGTVSALIYFQKGGKSPASVGYLDIQTKEHSVMVLFVIPTPDKARKRLPAGTVVTEPLKDGSIVTGRLTSEGGISAQGTYVPTRTFEDDISDIMRVFKSFRG